MGEQGRSTKTDLLDLTVSPSAKIIDFGESHWRAAGESKGAAMSDEELKIREELEMDIERGLEEEIKDGIYHLALRLHRLYQHQKERNAREVAESGIKNQQGLKNKTLSEVNINLKMEGGTKIEIKETKKEAPEGARPRTSRSENLQGRRVPTAKKLDWAKSLRSGTGPTSINKRNHYSSHQVKILSNDQSLYQNFKLDNARRNCASASGQHKSNVRGQNKLLELGWQS